MIKHEAQNRLNQMLDGQVETLLQKGYPALAGLTAADFMELVEPLKATISELASPEAEIRRGRIPFVLVVKQTLVAAEAALPLIEIKGQKGYVDMRPLDAESFAPLDSLLIPSSQIYLMVDIDTGRETLNVTPRDALARLQDQGRSPLTIDEGVALVTHFPEVLIDRQNYNCFSILGSRRGDQRVPAMWISSKKPRLGWCWDNNPHTWLGSASCGGRVGA